MKLRQPKNAPAIQRSFEILLGVGSEALRTVVAALNVDAALDLDQRPALNMREIGAPFARRMEPKFTFQLGTTERLPEKEEFSFEPGGWNGITMAQELHAPPAAVKANAPPCKPMARTAFL